MQLVKQDISEFVSWCKKNWAWFWTEFKGFLSRNRYGLMGTLAFHMILLIILLIFKLNTRRQFIESEIVLEIPEEVVESLEKQEEEEREKSEEAKENVAQSSKESMEQLLKSIAVNREMQQAAKTDPQENVEKMIEAIRKDLAGAEELATGKNVDEGFVEDSLNMLKDKEKQRMLDSLESIVYSGPSSVYYELKGRHKIYLPIPIYKCEGEGLVVVEITVNRSGKVTHSRILKDESAVDDSCLFDAAERAARKSRFNESPESPVLQKGKIHYNFVKQ